MKRIFGIAVWMLLSLAPCWGEAVVEIAAVVNDDIITTYQIEQRVLALQEGGAPGWKLDAERRAELGQKALDLLIDEALIRQRAKELEIEATPEEVDAAIRDIQRQNKLTEEQLRSALEAEGIDMETYRKNLKAQIERYQVIARDVQSRDEVTSEQVREYFREHIDDYRQPATLRLSHLVVTVEKDASPEQREAAKQKAKTALERIQGGEEFADVFISLSGDTDVRGGDMGTVVEGELAPDFARAVQGLEEGQVSDVVDFNGSYYLFKVEERHPGQIRQYDEVKEEIRRTIQERGSQGRLETWLKELREKAYIDIRTPQ